MSSARGSVYAALLEKAITETVNSAEKIDASKRLHVAQEGKAHPLWHVGHLATISNLLVNMWACNGENLMPKELRPVFMPTAFGGNPITTNAADYPAWDDALNLYKTVSAACVAGATTVTLCTARSASAITGNVASLDSELFVGSGSETVIESMSSWLAKVKVWKLGVVHSSVNVLFKVTSTPSESDAGVS